MELVICHTNTRHVLTLGTCYIAGRRSRDFLRAFSDHVSLVAPTATEWRLEQIESYRDSAADMASG